MSAIQQALLSDVGAGTGGQTPYGAAVTWDPSNKGTGVALSGGNLVATISQTSVNNCGVRATATAPAGKSIFELTIGAITGSTFACGGAGNSSYNVNTFLGGDQYGAGYDTFDGYLFINFSAVAGPGATMTTGDIMGVVLNTTTNYIYIYKNGVLQVSYNSSLFSTSIYAACSSNNSSGVSSSVIITANFGATSFAYTY
jgi:hypothetical protein